MPKRLTAVFLLFFLFSVLSACATTKKEGAPSSTEQTSRASYYDFEDILIPSEMELVKKDSFLYTTSRFKAGVLTFSGGVDPDSLAAFFQNNMAKNGWRQISTLKFRDTMLLFLKEDRACIITIKESIFSTTLGVRVGPIEQASSPAKGSPSR